MAGGEKFDLAVIGAGPGGYVACVRAVQLGMKVVCIEREAELGGVCLNVGCIPSKALLDSSEHFQSAVSRLAEHGVRTGEVRLDLPAMMARKDRVVKELADNVRKLLEGNQVKIVRGSGRLVGEDRVEVAVGAASAGGGSEGGPGGDHVSLGASRILLAAGSEPVAVPSIPFDGRRIVDSTGALAFDSVPKHLAIVGGGYIGLELGSVWRRLGAEVTVIEMMPRIAGLLDDQVGRALARILVKQGLVFRTSTKVAKADVRGDEIRLSLEADGEVREMDCDRLLVAVGRRPLTKGLGLEELNVKVDGRTGQVVVDEYYRTSVPTVYAIGDLIAGPMLAHKASAEGIAAVECMAGLAGEVRYDAIPSIIYTSPEVAGVGLTEEQAKARDIPYCVGSYPFAGAARARCMGETEGFVKMIAHARTDRLLGVHIIGPRASDLIGECVLAMEFDACSEDIARTVHGHPTFSEALHEAAMAVRKCSIHAS
jgi:dihydrolipoamide dehydrogenase